MSNNKQSSVEWLFERLWDTPKDKFTWHALLEQAKTMHREEIIEAYNESFILRDKPYATGEKYYKETFGENKPEE